MAEIKIRPRDVYEPGVTQEMVREFLAKKKLRVVAFRPPISREEQCISTAMGARDYLGNRTCCLTRYDATLNWAILGQNFYRLIVEPRRA